MVSACTPALVTYDPLTVPTDPVTATQLYKRSCESGHALGCRDLGFAYLEGRGVKKDLGRATETFRKACELGDPVGCSELAVSLCNGRGVAKDWTRTEALWVRACEGGATMGCWNLGLSRAAGECAARSIPGALQPLEKACEARNMEACELVGSLLLKSDEVPKDAARGVAHLATVCRSGKAEVCETAAVIAERELGQDGLEVARPLWEKGCALDRGSLCLRLADHLVAQPDTKARAVELFDKACRLKMDPACHEVARMRVTGEIPAPPGWAIVKAARYTRGSPDGERGRDADETRVEVLMGNHLYVKKTEVTWGEWRALMGTSVSSKELERLSSRWWMACGDRCPAVLSFNASLEYLNALSKKEGLEPCYTFKKGEPSLKPDCRGYRVPTEVEWERFARGGKPGMSWLGEHTETLDTGSPELDSIAVYGREQVVMLGGKRRCVELYPKRPSDAGSCGPRAVASKAPNPLGLHDVLGNVWEWTWDVYHTTENDLVVDPDGAILKSGKGPSGNSGSHDVYRAVRGCAWNSRPDHCRVANRAYANHRSEQAGVLVGLRPVRTIAVAR
jgi:formylglycine-generating enzyme required for sulfatase activity